MSRSRRRVVAYLLLAAVVLVPVSPALALNRRLDISQYAHTAWRISDGFPAATITAIAQTPDGYLWLATRNGLLRFDGIRATPWQPPPNQPLPSTDINHIATTRDGSLWISTAKGLVSWREGKLTSHKAPEEGYRVGRVLQDRDGLVWVTVFLPRLSNWFLCSVTSDRTECHGLDGGAGIGSIGIFEATNGQLWVATGDGVWRWKPGPARFYYFGKQLDGFLGLAEDARGALLISRPGRVERLIDGRLETLFRFPSGMSETRFLKMFSDRDGALWLYGSASGLLHFHQGVTDVFSEADGLSSDIVSVVFEDREGSVWVATVEGLHRFRDVAVATVSTRQGLPSPRANALAASPDGSVWISTLGGLTKMRDGKTIVYRERSALPAAAVQSVFRDSRGRIWASTELGVGYLEHDRFVKVNGVPGGVTRSITEDGDGTIWIANQAEGLLALPQGDQPRAAIAWASLGHADAASAVVGDPSRAGVWLGFELGGLVYFGGKATTTYSLADGLAPGRISHLHFDRAGTLWIATEGGLTRLKDGRLATLNPASGLPCDTVQWALADDAESLWLGMACGLVRISSGEITAWASAADRRHTPRGVLSTVFGSADGFRFLTGTPYSVPVVKSMDGRLWFRSLVGVNVLDPGSLPFNRLPPPVHIEHVIADRKTYDLVSSGAGGLRLPSLTRDLQIDFTALSFVAPEKNRFRYWLEGRDTDWQDAGTRRQAFYSDLSPRQYRFRVIASNNDGVWNATGATVDFEIAPAYFQTTWFMALVAGTLLTLVWTVHRVRLRVVETDQRQIIALNEKLMSAQEQERVRIAGELHDGVMQEMLAATMMLGAAKRRATNDSETQGAIDKVQQKLIRMGTDLRQLSHELHPPALQEAGLPKAVEDYCEEFSTASAIPLSCHTDPGVDDLSRGTSLALFRILQEALGNAAKHSQAKQITVRLTREANMVALSISDDGIGFDRTRLGPSRGLGLITIRERASQLNGRFEVDTGPGRGTTITVVIPFR